MGLVSRQIARSSSVSLNLFSSQASFFSSRCQRTIFETTSSVSEIKSISRTGLSIVYVEVGERVEDPGKEFDDIKLKLDSVRDLPDGAGPIFFVKDFGDTTATFC